MVTINIGRKEMIFFGAIILVFAVVGFGVAYGGNQPNVMGHTTNEIGAPAGCSPGDSLVWNGASWDCGSSGDSNPLACFKIFDTSSTASPLIYTTRYSANVALWEVEVPAECKDSECDYYLYYDSSDSVPDYEAWVTVRQGSATPTGSYFDKPGLNGDGETEIFNEFFYNGYSRFGFFDDFKDESTRTHFTVITSSAKTNRAYVYACPD